MKNRMVLYGIFFLLLLGLGVGIYNLPLIKSRLDWRLDELRAKIKYAISPPEQSVFIPQEQKREAGTQVAQVPILAESVTNTPIPSLDQSEPADTPIPTPAVTPTSIPARVQLTGFRHEYQGWNNCGPATLSMALSFWGWTGDQYDIAPIIKPNPRDKNVMPAELAGYVESRTRFKVILRLGGDLDLLKRFVAAGYPVIVEKGFESPKFDGWMGHYELITGYDNGQNLFTAQDSYMGPGLNVSYETLESFWRAFNFTYLVVFPVERESEVATLLGPHLDEAYNLKYFAQKAGQEVSMLAGRDLYFAWFNLGSSRVALQDYAGAADAFDRAFAMYSSIPQKSRPWRMLWYQTGPYQAYYNTGRYQDVIDLATETLNIMSEPVLEEAYYWRALAKDFLGDTKGAMQDLKTSLKYHPGFEPSLIHLKQITPKP
jgi:hypothetical protein